MQAFDTISRTVRTTFIVAALGATGGMLGGIDTLAHYSQSDAQQAQTALMAKAAATQAAPRANATARAAA